MDWTGTHFCKLNLDWNHTAGHVDIFMKNYNIKALKKLLHIPLTRAQHLPHKWTVPIYGTNEQYTPVENTSMRPNVKEIRQI